MTGEAIFLMKDLHRYLADAAVARKCLDLAPAFGHDRRVIVMSAVKVELPPELEPLTARFTLDLPGADELKSVVKRVVAECARERPVSMGLSPADLDRLVDRLRGFTTFEAERAITQAILRDNTLDARDIDLIVEIKKEARTFGLEPSRGILLLGVQGSGKALVARAVAREWGPRVRRLQRRGDRAGGGRRPLHRVLARRGGQLAHHRRGAEGHEAAR
jgi:hypothetical protein